MLEIIRHLIAALYLSIVASFGFLYCLLRPFNPSNLYPIARLVGYTMKIYGIRLEIDSIERLNAHTPCVFVSNHQSSLDMLPCAATVPFRTVSLGKQSIRWIPFFGQFYWISGNILINRSNRKKAFASMAKTAKSLKERDISVWIMPEGTRNYDNDILPFKRGAFHTAINAKVPIVPVSISSYSSINLNKFHAGVIMMKVHDPIDTEKLSSHEIPELTEQVRHTIIGGIREIDQKIKV